MSSADKNANGQQFMENGDSHRRLNKSLLCLVMLWHMKIVIDLLVLVQLVRSSSMTFQDEPKPFAKNKPSQIFPLKLRAQGASIEVAVNRLTNAAISMSFISIYNAITIGGAFFLCLLVYLYGLGCSSTFSCLKPRAWPWKRWRCSSAKTREGSQLQKQTRGRMHSCIYICFLWRGRIFIMSSENLNFIIVLYI
ncbi:hypothetical protein JHK85_002153 [Glycine max]|uniref:Uncharacterized protein n=1 Tax=Glycine max TaxID=3847 RepID=A0A0R0LJC5_SOYBN|nr:hypothetical protein JHK87_002092 [Glycine soja]KAG5069776.1 hypothetical protein JHK85_002153 [Glycine max]KAG5089488.1 hypothetical protein JHK86_002100 [Glycine max]